MQVFVPRFVSQIPNSLQIYTEHFAFSKFFDKKNALFVKKVRFLRFSSCVAIDEVMRFEAERGIKNIVF